MYVVPCASFTLGAFNGREVSSPYEAGFVYTTTNRSGCPDSRINKVYRSPEREVNKDGPDSRPINVSNQWPDTTAAMPRAPNSLMQIDYAHVSACHT